MWKETSVARLGEESGRGLWVAVLGRTKPSRRVFGPP